MGSVKKVTAGDKDIVFALQAALTERIGRDRYEVWFGAGAKLQLADGCLRITASDQFRLDRLKSFRSDLQWVAQSISGETLTLEYRIDSSLAPSENEQPSTAGRPVGSSQRSHPNSPPSAPPVHHSAVRSRLQLEDFVVGPHARVAFTAARETCLRPGVVTPLFLYGPTGTGKTHLLEGIAEATRRARRLRRVLMMSAEQFTTQFVEALKGSGLPSFRNKYRGVDMLLLDDAHFFLGKRSTLGELQYTVDTLLRANKQLVLSSDRPLSELAALGPELSARLTGGLVCGLSLPDRETRLEIIRRLAERRGIDVPGSVLEYVASEVTGDPRQLSGALNRLRATSVALQRPIDIAMAEQTLADICRASLRVVRLADVEDVVCSVFGIDTEQLHSHRKAKAISQPRSLAMWLARKATRAPYSEIGSHFGGRSHSTVISAERKVQQWVAAGAKIQLGLRECDVNEAIRRLETRLRTG